MPKESYLQAKIIRYLNSVPNSYWNVNVGSVFSTGRLDIEGCYYGIFIAIELKNPRFKTPENHLRPEQKVHMERIRRAGGIAHVMTSLAQVEALIERIHPYAVPKDPYLL